MKDSIAYLKYEGGSANEGIMSSKDVVSALKGYDEMIRYFLSHEDLALSNANFDLPIRIRQKCIEISIPDTVSYWIIAGPIVGIALNTYLKTTAKKAAEDGFKNTGAVKDLTVLFRGAAKLAIRGAMLAKHVGTFTSRTFKDVKFSNNNTEVGIPNDRGEYFYVPTKYLDIYKKCPKKIYSKISKPINSDLSAELGVIEDNGKIMKEKITVQEKEIFYFGDEEEELLFPELKHGENIEIEGEITRAIESTQTIGLKYKEHVLTCRPDEGGIASFKKEIISREDDHIYNVKVKISGVVDRVSKEGDPMKRPRIIFSNIVSMEQDKSKNSLFRKMDL